MTEQQAIKIINEEKSWESDDRKIDAFIMAVNALGEIQKYSELERKLNGVDLTMLANSFIEHATEGEIQGYQRGRILTNEDADKWDAYLAIGTPEECRAAVDKQMAKKAIETEKFNVQYFQCSECGFELYSGQIFCDECGQRILWEV